MSRVPKVPKVRFLLTLMRRAGIRERVGRNGTFRTFTKKVSA